jgi:hypothetical protein
MLSIPLRVGYIHEPFNPERKTVCGDRFDKWFTYLGPADTGGREEYEACLWRALQFHYDPLPRAREESLWDICAAAYHVARSVANRAIASRSLMKDPIALLSAEWLYETFDMDVVVMVRHPAAFAGSLKAKDWTFPFEDFLTQTELMQTHFAPYREGIRAMHNRKSTIVEQAALLWRCLYSVVANYRKRYPSWEVVMYEDLVSNPASHYQCLYRKLGLRWTPRIRRKIEGRTEANIKKWKRRLCRDEIQYLKQETSEVWSEFYSGEDWE